jgi:hypothetical protein
MAKYGDENFIYRMAHEPLPEQEVETENDIMDGYITIRDERIPFNERCIVKDWLYMTIPTDFVLMSEEGAKIKYPNVNRPHIIYTNEDGTTNITFTFSKDKLTNDKIEEAKSYLEQTITGLNPARKIISSAVLEAGIKIGYFDFMSPAIGCEIYNLMFIFPLDGQFVVGCFNCLPFDKIKWSEAAVQMLSTIRVPD